MDRYTFDDDYVRRLLAGDPPTVDHFHAYFNELMLLKLRTRLRTIDDVNDVRQETFTRVWQNLPNLRVAGALGSFVNTTCEHVYLEYIRKNKRAERTDAAPEQPIDPDRLLEELISGEASARVRRILSGMKDAERQLLTDLFLDELPKEAICRKLNIKLENFRVRLFRAKQHFRELFERKSTPPFPPAMTIFVTLGRLWSPWL